MTKNDTVCIVRQINANDDYHGAIYAFVNVVEKKVYVGETGQGDNRELTHAKCLFGLEQGSNTAFVDKNQTREYCLIHSALLNKTNKDYDKIQAETLETIYMYLFKKYGFELYNMPKGRDNLGGDRKFLKDSKMENSRDIYEKLIKLIEKDCPQVTQVEQFEVDTWREFVKEADKLFVEEFNDTFNFHIEEIPSGLDNQSKEIRRKLWRNFVERARNIKDFVIIEDMKSESDFFKLNKKYLQSINEGKHNYSINNISLKKLLDDGRLDRIIYTKAGDYLGESLLKILSNKASDLSKGCGFAFDNNNVVEKACLWSLKGNQTKWLRQQLDSDGNHEDKYMILSYTGSKKCSGKQEVEQVVKVVSLDRLKKQKKIDYPQEFKAEIVSGNYNNMAFVVSDLYYVDENITGKDIEGIYLGIFES